MANIWTKDNEYEDVTNIEQALWHLKVMRGGIRSCLYSPSTQQHMDEEDMKIGRVQEQVLTVAIDYIKQNIMGLDAEPYEWISHKEYCERHHQKPLVYDATHHVSDEFCIGGIMERLDEEVDEQEE